MKKSIIQQFAVFVCAISLLFITTSCGGEKISDESGSNTHTSKTDPARMPLNLSVYLDLSNRLTRDVVPSQSDRDKALIAYLIEKFKERCKRDKAKECANHFQVFFYPTPADPKIAELANDLDCDFGKMDVGAKNEAMNSIDEKFNTALDQIYSTTLENKYWIGCDIWSFFSTNKIDHMCIRPGFRNILVILTDGFIYHMDNVNKIDGTYTYIPANVQSPDHTLNVKRKGLSNLEVLVMEVNPMKPQQFQTLSDIWSNWLSSMEVNHFEIVDTDIPNNNKQVIQNFLQQ